MTDYKSKNGNKALLILLTLTVLALLQAAREIIQHIFLHYSGETLLQSKTVNMIFMFCMCAVFIIVGIKTKHINGFFPSVFSKKYIIFTVISIVLLASSPTNYTGGLPALLALFYGSIITPLYEELIFRHFIYKKFEECFSKKITVFILNVILFTVWHLGYMTENIISGNITAVLWKLGAGCGYGIILSSVRMKTGNAYSSTLVHGVLNMFMI